VVMLIVFLGLTQAAFLSINHNMRNSLRDEAVAIASDQLSRLKGRTFDDMDGLAGTDPTPANFNMNQTRTYKNIAPLTFTVAVNIIRLDADTKQITITTTWAWQGDAFTHQIMTTRRRGA
ncbi:MAG: hypothetical protein Q8K68_00315, partial [Nitrospirota bacterium]|nr:hypothetical protein [Nitrospirota bacterium]